MSRIRRILFLFLFSGNVIGLTTSFSWALAENDLKTTPKMEFLDKSLIKSQGKYPLLASWLTNEKIKYSQKSERQYHFSHECQIDKQPMRDPKSFVDFWLRCEKELKHEGSWAITHSLKTLMLKLKLMDNPWARPVMFHLDGGQNVQGLLAMKPDSIPRPLVILRLGIFGSSTEMQAERFLFMQLFEESPFHLLVLESLSGADASAHNQSPLLGGVVEGLQHLEVAQELLNAKNPLSERIQSLHLAGISLGGNGVLFAAEMQSLQKVKYFSSFIGYCPVVNLAETLAFHQGQSVTLAAMDWWASYRLQNWSDKIHFNPKEGFINWLFENVEKSYLDWLKSTNQILKFPTGYNKNTFWSASRIQDHIALIDSPFLVIATEKDPIVPYNLNSKNFEKRDNITLLKLSEGYHCTLPAAYDWYTSGQLVQKFILNYSADFHLTMKHKDFDIKGTGLASGRSLNKSNWYLQFKRKEGQIEVTILPKEDWFDRFRRFILEIFWHQPKAIVFNIPITNFFSSEIPAVQNPSYQIADLDAFTRSLGKSWENEAGQSMWERWLNHNISWEISDTSIRLSWPIATNPNGTVKKSF